LENPRVLTPFPHADLNVKMNGDWGSALPVFPLKQRLYEILQILSISIFDKMPINQLFQQTQLQYFKEQKDNQLNIFDL
jgi:hypothetical protein